MLLPQKARLATYMIQHLFVKVQSGIFRNIAVSVLKFFGIRSRSQKNYIVAILVLVTISKPVASNASLISTIF